jgi:hypothetical protein
MFRKTTLVLVFVFLAALALAAAAAASDVQRVDDLTHLYAPAATVVCDTQVPRDYIGRTITATGAIDLNPFVCLGVFLYGADARYLRWFHHANPGIDVDRAIGVGILVTLHEAQHAAGVWSETTAECLALRYAQPLLAAPRYARAWQEAVRFDSGMPAVYHDGTAC